MRRAVVIATLLGSLTFAVSACAAPGPTGVRLAKVGDFASPTYLTAPPGDRARRFVTERTGRVVMLHKGKRSVFLDISSRVPTNGEGGLLSMAFHPRYASNRRYFVYYTATDGAIVIAQFRATRDGNRTRPGSGRRVLRQAHFNSNHKGGQLQFGHDGMLYAGLGDGGGSGDPDRNAQDRSTLLGKIIRIAPKPNGGYRVPRDNPFAGGRPGRGEIFAYGLRNPWRFSFDRLTGSLAIADVGQEEVEEVDLLPVVPRLNRPRGGANLGWSIFEGRRRYRPGGAPGHVKPVVERLHRSGSCSITGGYVIRDRSLGALRGKYVFGDLCDARLRVAKLRPGRTVAGRLLGVGVSSLVSFGEDASGRVYAVSLDGGVFRLAPRR